MSRLCMVFIVSERVSVFSVELESHKCTCLKIKIGIKGSEGAKNRDLSSE